MAKTAAERQHDYRLRHPERVKQSKAHSREAHKTSIVAYRKKYYVDNREYCLTLTRAWRKRNREALLQYSRDYEKTHREARRAKDRLYNKTAARLASQKVWRQRHPVAYRLILKRGKAIRRARELAAAGTLSSQAIAARIAYYGERCWICQAPWAELDHVIPLARGGTNWPSNIRPACYRCNRSKGAKLMHKRVAA